MKKKLIFLLVLALIVIGGSSAFFNWSKQPARSAPVAVTFGNDVKGVSTTLEDFDTSLFATKITSNLRPKSQSNTPDSSIVGQYLFTDKNPYVSDQLAITVGTAKENLISEVSPVKFRQTFPDDYTETIPAAGFPASSVVFVKKVGYEKGVFWVENGRYAGVVVSGGVENKAQLEETVRSSVSNWQWK